MRGRGRKAKEINFYWTQAKAVQLNEALTLQASITQQSTGLLAMKAAALGVDQKKTINNAGKCTNRIPHITGQNHNSTAIAESLYRTLEHLLVVK
jgi:hypothetical protein